MGTKAPAGLVGTKPIARSALVLLAGSFLTFAAVPARADDAQPSAALASGSDAGVEGYATGGVAACVECHDETEDHPVLSILKTRHATLSDPRAPLALESGCQACHGPSAAHVEDPDKFPPAVVFGQDRPVAAQDEVCLRCHSAAARMNWTGSQHESAGVSCTACHDLHTDQDTVLRRDVETLMPSRRNPQAEVCFHCHLEQRAEIQRTSSHPIRQGTVTCSDCHNSHGSAGPYALKALTLNETCYQCHADKRGPFLWDHTPVREDCSSCHMPHGSTQSALLTSREPFLCQECHLGTRHVSMQYSGTGVVSMGGAEGKLLGGSCTNCHVEIHGSNHPSGVRWTR